METLISFLIVALIIGVIAFVIWLIVRGIVLAFMGSDPNVGRILAIIGAVIALIALLLIVERLPGIFK